MLGDLGGSVGPRVSGYDTKSGVLGSENLWPMEIVE